MRHPETGWRLGRRPALDGLRGLAVILVVAAHVRLPGIGGAAGDTGVTIFFTLSGFLIATLLCEERETNGRIDLPRFYERRARRLLPALIVVVAASVVITTATGIAFVTWPEVIGALTYSTNLIGIFTPIPVDGMLHHTWSLVIEEQFYLVWPLLTMALWRHRTALLSLVGLGVLFAVVRRIALLFTDADIERVAYSVPMRVDGILIGCGLALLLRGRSAPPAVRGGSAALWTVALWALAPGGVTFVLGLSLIAGATAIVIMAILADRGPAWLEWKPLRMVGGVSYGLYLWHHVVLMVSDRALGFRDDWAITTLIVVPTSALLTWLSWRYIELPWLRRGTRSERRPQAPVTLGRKHDGHHHAKVPDAGELTRRRPAPRRIPPR